MLRLLRFDNLISSTTAVRIEQHTTRNALRMRTTLFSQVSPVVCASLPVLRSLISEPLAAAAACIAYRPWDATSVSGSCSIASFSTIPGVKFNGTMACLLLRCHGNSHALQELLLGCLSEEMHLYLGISVKYLCNCIHILCMCVHTFV